MSEPRRSALRAITVGGVVAGTLDLLFAVVVYGYARGGTEEGVLHSIASGWLGRKAFQGGGPAAVLGFATQYLIAVGAAAVFYAISGAFPVLRRRAVPAGIVFGAGLYAFMYCVVMPLSAVPFRPSFAPKGLLPALAAHMFLIGLPIALCARRYGGFGESP
jgi:hypothetical protein